MRSQVFTLPKVSAKLKLKLTALEGSRVRRVGVAHFGSCRAEDYGEHHLAVLTNLGDIQVVSMPLLKPQVRYSCIRREDVSGIASCVFTKYGQGVQAWARASVGLELGERVSQARPGDGEARATPMWSSARQALP
ncbi:LLGL scribble cell polarity complex component 2-like [Acomys russatus]|uniref:LLGL scribble cell polarity complex component 2-like n=1 Tax=Acomys russatus TaxID=60746 RepID=UPI0021E3379B|nr:LLGL scribble cell polarity complex component 2-like [Acomys russatus]